MNMNQKGFINIIVIVIVVVLAGAGAYFVLNLKSQLTPTPPPTPIPGAPTAGPITVNGEMTCLPKKGSQQTLECAMGLKGLDGRHFGLKNLFQHDPEYKFSVGGLRVEVSGVFIPEEITGPDGNKYDVVGTIDVTSIKEITDGSAQLGTSTIQPEDPERSGLAPYPDLSLISLPKQPHSVKFVVEHRSALNGKTILIRGIIVGTLLGEKACPPDRGMCAQPSIYLADTIEKNRNTLYDLRTLVGEEEQEKSYPIGKTIDLQVTVDGSKVSVVARKTY